MVRSPNSNGVGSKDGEDDMSASGYDDRSDEDLSNDPHDEDAEVIDGSDDANNLEDDEVDDVDGEEDFEENIAAPEEDEETVSLDAEEYEDDDVSIEDDEFGHDGNDDEAEEIDADGAEEIGESMELDLSSPEREQERLREDALSGYGDSLPDKQLAGIMNAEATVPNDGNAPLDSNSVEMSAVQKFFFSRLLQSVLKHGGDESMLNSFRIEVTRRKGVLLGGLLDVFYVKSVTTPLRRFRCRVDVIVFLGLMPYSKTIKNMSTAELADLAIENREKQLISYQIDVYGGDCSDIVVDRDNIIVIPRHVIPRNDFQVTATLPCSVENTANITVSTNTSLPAAAELNLIVTEPSIIDENVVQGTETAASQQGLPIAAKSQPKIEPIGKPLRVMRLISKTDSSKPAYFGYGNSTVLDWGVVISAPAFHTRTQIYPLGFKCVRQEHDVLLDRVVDCYCEIDSYVSRPADLVQNAPAEIAPLFRVSIAWQLGQSFQKCVRVYEGKSPQLAWQAAMLETIGADETSMLNFNDSFTDNLITISDGAILKKCPPQDDAAVEQCTVVFQPSADEAASTEDLEVMDDEERALRKQLMEHRRDHMRSLHRSQVSGNHSPVKPRLSIDAVDTFFDEGILRLIEGMCGVTECENYEYVEVRSSDSGHRGTVNALSNMQSISRKLDAVYEEMCEHVDNALNPKIAAGQLSARRDKILDAATHDRYRPTQVYEQREKMNQEAMQQARQSKMDALQAREKERQEKLDFAEKIRLQRLEEFEIRKKKREEEKKKEDDTKLMRAEIAQERRNKARELDKLIRSVKENTLKLMLAKRADSRSRVEQMCDMEEVQLQLGVSPYFTLCATNGSHWMTSHRVALFGACLGISSPHVDDNSGRPMDLSDVGRSFLNNNKSPLGDMDICSTSSEDRDRVVSTTNSSSLAAMFRLLPGDSLGEVLEIWGSLHVFSKLMDVSVVPSPEKFITSIISCDFSHRQNSASLANTVFCLRNIVSKEEHVAADTGRLNDTSSLLNTLERLIAPSMSVRESESLLNDVAIAFCKLLAPDFNHWMGIDGADSILCGLRCPINTVTWREIARVSLSAALLQEAGLNELTIAATLRGRGHTTAPDMYDKITLRLSRQRILQNGRESGGVLQRMRLLDSFDDDETLYGRPMSRNSYRQAMSRFTSLRCCNNIHCGEDVCTTLGCNGAGARSFGTCIRFPAPGGVNTPVKAKHFYGKSGCPACRDRCNASWQHTLSLLHDVPGDADKSAITRILIMAIEQIVTIPPTEMDGDHFQENIAVARLLTSLISEQYSSSAKEMKANSLLLLHSFTDPEHELDSDEVIGTRYSYSPIRPISILEAWENSQRALEMSNVTPISISKEDGNLLPQYLAALSAFKSNGAAVGGCVVPMEVFDQVESPSTFLSETLSSLSVEVAELRLKYLEYLHLMRLKSEEAQHEFPENDNDEEGAGEADDGAAVSTGRSRQSKNGFSPPFRPKDSKGRYLSNKAIAALRSDVQYPTSSKEAGGIGYQDVRTNIADDPNMWAQLYPNDEDKWIVDRVSSASVVVQRCFLVIYHLMTNVQASIFNYPLDLEKLDDYVECIERPICFADIRQCLLEGHYGSNILSVFYRDVIIIFENALAFNPEFSPAAQAALKLGITFERLYFEIVIDVDRKNIEQTELCLTCRQAGIDADTILCDRCDGAYHMTCLDPPMEFLPRGDWFCPSCVQGKKARDVHPLVGCLVCPQLDSASPEVGRVIDLRQISAGGAADDLSVEPPQYCLQYVVMFPAYTPPFISSTNEKSETNPVRYEIWTGAEIRRSCCDYVTRLGGAVELISVDPPGLPNGYSYGDYEDACILSRGYDGWGNLSMFLPSAVSGSSYIPIKYLLQGDRTASRYQRAIVALSPMACSNTLSATPIFGAREWIEVLMALSHRAILSNEARDYAQSLDEECTASSSAMLENAIKSANRLNGTTSTASINASIILNLVTLVNNISKQNMNNTDIKIGDRIVFGNLSDGDNGTDEQTVPSNVEVNDSSSDEDELESHSVNSDSEVALVEPNAVNPKKKLPKLVKTTSKLDISLNSITTDNDGKPSTLKPVSTELSASPSVATVAEIDPKTAWLGRRASRRRGKDDACFSAFFFREILPKLESELKEDIAIEMSILRSNGDESELNLHNFSKRSIVFQTIVRLLANKPAETVEHPDEWLKGWDIYAKNSFELLDSIICSASAGNSISEEVDGHSTMKYTSSASLCQLCGYDEYSIGSAFVKGETRHEWDVATTYLASARGRRAMDHRGNVYVNCFPVAQIDEDLGVFAKVVLGELSSNKGNFLSSFSSAANSYESQLLEFYSIDKDPELTASGQVHWRVMRDREREKEIVWLPVDPRAAELENQDDLFPREKHPFAGDSKSMFVPVRREGSLVVHECCADYVHSMRKTATLRIALRYLSTISDVLVGIHKGKNIPLGCDGNGNVYWRFPCAKNVIYICVPTESADSKLHFCDANTNNDSQFKSGDINFPPDYCGMSRSAEVSVSKWNTMSGRYTDSVASPYCGTYSEDVCQWKVLDGIDDILKLAHWLKPSVFSEHQLLIILQLLYPEVLLSIQASKGYIESNDLPFNSSRIVGTMSASNPAPDILLMWRHISECRSSADRLNLLSPKDNVRENLRNSDGQISMEVCDNKEVSNNSKNATDGVSEVSTDKVAVENSQVIDGSTSDSTASEDDELVDSSEEEAEFDENNETSLPRKRGRVAVSHRSNKRQNKSSVPDTGDDEDDYDDALEQKKSVLDTFNLGPRKKTQVKRLHDEYTDVRREPTRRTKSNQSINDLSGTTISKNKSTFDIIPVSTQVLVYNRSNGLYWNATVEKSFDFGKDQENNDGSKLFYLIRFLNWGPTYDQWVPATLVNRKTRNILALQAEGLKRYEYECSAASGSRLSSLPVILTSLKSCQHLLKGGIVRWTNSTVTFDISGNIQGLEQLISSVLFNDSNCGSTGDYCVRNENWYGDLGCTVDSDIRILKAAMLIIEASLPQGCVDTSEERWGEVSEEFIVQWRAAVIGATDAVSLLECQILLEFSVRTAWLSAEGAKLLTCMPSRTHSSRYATYGLVALRIWALDEAIRFDKAITYEDLDDEMDFKVKGGRVSSGGSGSKSKKKNSRKSK